MGGSTEITIGILRQRWLKNKASVRSIIITIVTFTWNGDVLFEESDQKHMWKKKRRKERHDLKQWEMMTFYQKDWIKELKPLKTY